MTSRRLRGLAISALLLLPACGELPPARAGVTSAPLPFENAAATRILVATFPALPTADLADALPGLIEAERARFEAMAPAAAGSSPRALETKRIDIPISRHIDAHALLIGVGADILVWGSGGCRGARAATAEEGEPAAMCLHVTIDLARRDRGTPADKQLDLEGLTDFNLPPMSPSSRVGLARYLVGVHFRGDGRDLLAAQALTEAAALIAAEGRDYAWIDAYLARVELRSKDGRAAYTRAEAAIIHLTEKQGAVESALDLTLGEARLAEHDPLGASVHFAHALSIAEKVLEHGHPYIAAVETRIGRAAAELGHFHAALAHFQRALTLDEAYFGADHLQLARDWEYVGSQLVNLRDVGAAEALKHAESIYRAKRGPEGLDIMRLEERLGVDAALAREHARAIEYYRRALALREQSGLHDDNEIAVQSNLAHSLSQRGEHAEAVITRRKALARAASLDGAGSARLADCNRLLAVELLKGDEYQEGVEYLLSAIPIDATVYGANDARVAAGEKSAALVMLRHQDLQRAVEHFARALAILEANLPAEDGRIDTARTWLAIAIAARSGRKPDEESAGVVVVDCAQQECNDSGLKRGDWLVSVGATTIKDAEHMKQLASSAPAKRKVTLTLLRGGKKIRLQGQGPEVLQLSYTSWTMPKP